MATALSVRTSPGARVASLRCPVFLRGSLIVRQPEGFFNSEILPMRNEPGGRWVPMLQVNDIPGARSRAVEH
jgi:hypothetical protein